MNGIGGLKLPRITLRRVEPREREWPEDLRWTRAPEAALAGSDNGVSPTLSRAASWTWRMLIVGLGIYVIAQVIGYFSEIAVPFFVAVLLAALLAPVRQAMVRFGLPGGLATAVTMLGTIGVIVGLITLTGTQLVSGFSQLSAEVTTGLERVQTWLREGPLHLSSSQLQTYLDELQAQVTKNREQLLSGALSGATTAGAALTGTVLALFCLLFLLHDGRGVWDWVVGLLPRGSRRTVDIAARRGWVTLTSYVRATMIVAATDALGIAIGAALLGVPLAIPIGVLTFLAAFVPMIGAILSGAVAVLVALVALGPIKALFMLGVVVAVQQTESHILQPLLLGRAVHLHPLAVVLSLGAGFVVAGIVGGVFAVPLMAFLNTVRHSVQDQPEKDPAEPDEEFDAPLAVDPVDPEDVVEEAPDTAKSGGKTGPDASSSLNPPGAT